MERDVASRQAERTDLNNSRAEERAFTNGPLQTVRNPRFSYMETPYQMSHPHFEQFSSPPNSAIDESPMSALAVQNPLFSNEHPAYRMSSPYPNEKEGPSRTASPYNFPPPEQVHPAHFAPYADEAPHSPSRGGSPANQYPPMPPQSYSQGPEQLKKLPESPFSSAMPFHPSVNDRAMEMPKLDVKRTRTPTYNPHSPAGPNITVENHLPGQISHPNATVDPEWKHGLCELDTTCCIGLLCPCILYGKTQYRLSQKAQKHQATDLLGYETCNGSCMLMGVACGFQCL